MYLHFNKGLILENLKKREKKYSFRPSEGILSNNYIFGALWRCRGGPLVTPTRGHFLINCCKRDLFIEERGEVWGVRRVLARGREWGWRAAYDLGTYLPYYVLLCTSQCYQPGMLFCVYIQMSSSHSDWDPKESFTRVISRPKIPQAPMWLNLSMILALNLIF